MEDWTFYKTVKWEKAYGEDDLDTTTDYEPCEKCGFSMTVSCGSYEEEDGYPCEGDTFNNYKYFRIASFDDEIMLMQNKKAVLVKNPDDDTKLDVAPADEEYELLVYNSKTKKTTKYKVSKVKEVDGYHPVLS